MKRRGVAPSRCPVELGDDADVEQRRRRRSNRQCPVPVELVRHLPFGLVRHHVVGATPCWCRRCGVDEPAEVCRRPSLGFVESGTVTSAWRPFARTAIAEAASRHRWASAPSSCRRCRRFGGRQGVVGEGGVAADVVHLRDAARRRLARAEGKKPFSCPTPSSTHQPRSWSKAEA